MNKRAQQSSAPKTIPSWETVKQAVEESVESPAGRRIAPVVVDAEIALRMDEAWRREVKRKVSSFVRQARSHWRSRKVEDQFLAGKSRGLAAGLLAAARQLKGLLR